MRKIAVIFFVLTLSQSIEAQTITLGPITDFQYCVGDTLTVPYQASGAFAVDNTFNLQFSDSSGSFAEFTIIGRTAGMSGSNFRSN